VGWTRKSTASAWSRQGLSQLALAALQVDFCPADLATSCSYQAWAYTANALLQAAYNVSSPARSPCID
jgi:hypothetical protein